jgi:integrase
MDYRDVPAFIAHLRECDAIAAMALDFCILTATRSGEVYGARWSEIDMAAKVWTVPAARTKAAREHRVPLSEPSLANLEKLGDTMTGDYVFPSPRGRKLLSHVSMAKVMRRLQIGGATVHGFRSAFRDWAGNETHFPREIAEAGLSHVIGDKAERAYRRGDALEKRRGLMDEMPTTTLHKRGNPSSEDRSEGGDLLPVRMNLLLCHAFAGGILSREHT